MAMQPWMYRRIDETAAEHSARVARTCCWCGKEDTDFPASVAHEDVCPKRHGAPKGETTPKETSS